MKDKLSKKILQQWSDPYFNLQRCPWETGVQERLFLEQITIPSRGKVEMSNSSMIQRIERESERILCRRKFVNEDIENEQTREFSGRKREKEKEGVEKIIRGRKREKDMQKEKTFCIGTQKFSSCVVFYVPIFYVPSYSKLQCPQL